MGSAVGTLAPTQLLGGRLLESLESASELLLSLLSSPLVELVPEVSSGGSLVCVESGDVVAVVVEESSFEVLDPELDVDVPAVPVAVPPVADVAVDVVVDPVVPVACDVTVSWVVVAVAPEVPDVDVSVVVPDSLEAVEQAAGTNNRPAKKSERIRVPMGFESNTALPSRQIRPSSAVHGWKRFRLTKAPEVRRGWSTGFFRLQTSVTHYVRLICGAPAARGASVASVELPAHTVAVQAQTNIDEVGLDAEISGAASGTILPHAGCRQVTCVEAQHFDARALFT